MKRIVFFTSLLLSLTLTYQINQSNDVTEIEARTYLDTENIWIFQTSDFKPEIKYIATAFYTNSGETKGWDLLSISTNSEFTDQLQSEAAGRLEAYLTESRIYSHYTNIKTISKPFSEDVANFFKTQEQFIVDTYASRPEDPYIYNAYLLYLQYKGGRDQYNFMQTDETRKIENIEFNQMAAFGDLFDINAKFYPTDFEAMSYEEKKLHFFGNSHCSALFKSKSDLSDIFLGHNSWYYYSMMTRIFKEYNFNFTHESIKTKNIMFSSYPATLASNDDFYVTSSDLAIIETTNPSYNNPGYEYTIPQSLLCWQRAQIANRMSETGVEWANNFIKYNSGTYNNMFMALDMKKIDLEAQHIQDEAGTIVDQMPLYYGINDGTVHLRYGYWPSYNTPYDKNIIKVSKIQEQITKDPKMAKSLDYDTCARAKIFRRDQYKINDIDKMKEMLRYNDYKNDPFSEGDPTDAVSARGDLMSKPKCFGAYDTKMSSVSLLKGKNKIVHLIGGPTTQGVDRFIFSNAEEACKGIKHEGINDDPNFEWFEFTNKFDM